MVRLNHQRQAVNLPPVRPCEVFDQYRRVGKIAKLNTILLGRLERLKDMDECVKTYSEQVTRTISENKSSWSHSRLEFPKSVTV